MNALHRLRSSRYESAALKAYAECIAEYRANMARRAREDWLRQEINLAVRRVNVIRAKLIFAVEERLCPVTLNRQLVIQQAALEVYREELRELRSEQ